MSWSPEQMAVPVPGGELDVTRYGSAARSALAVHGIGATSRSFTPVLPHLDPDVALVAPDLRGRGRSGGLGPPYGLRQHADDLVSVLDHLGLDAVPVMGESMGAYVAVVLAAMHPDRVERLVLVDGGTVLDVPPLAEGVDPQVVIDLMAAGIAGRLDMTFPTYEALHDHWRAHPALVDSWGPVLQEYVEYDVAGSVEPELRSSVSLDAIKGDYLALLHEPDLMQTSLNAVRCPAVLLQATRGMEDQPEPMLSDDVIERTKALVPQLVHEIVDDTNHYTICLGERGARRIADHLCDRVAR